MADLGWSRYIANEEDKNEQACRSCALRNGHTIQEADDCEDGSVNCPDCPFRPLETKVIS